MKKTDPGYTLVNVDDEDVTDVIVKLEKSFGINFRKDAFVDVSTFGDLCDVFASYIRYNDQNDCTTQQAFYRVRAAAAETLKISREEIVPDTKLAELFPFHDRRKKMKEFRGFLGADIKLLTYPRWLFLVVIAGFLCSFVALFHDAKRALGGIILFWLVQKIADRLGKVLKYKTVRELSEHLGREHYMESRRSRDTVNRNEIDRIILETFCIDLGIEKRYLTRDAKFGWVK